MEKETKSAHARFSSDELRELLPSFTVQSRDRLARLLSDPSLRGEIPAAEVGAILSVEHIAPEDLMVDLLPIAQLYSQSPLSRYCVGALVRGTSGSLFLGTNIEIPHQPLSSAVHGEQCAVTNAFMHHERGLTTLAVTAAPCGHCRQFLNELPSAADLKIIVKGSSAATLAALLPASFGPGELGVTERLFSGKKLDLQLITHKPDKIAVAALEAATRAYSPYTHSPSGVAILSSTTIFYEGSYIENAAYNPSLSPLQAALAGLIMAGECFGSISSVVLVELENAPISQVSATRAVLDSIAPAASLRRVAARLKQ